MDYNRLVTKYTNCIHGKALIVLTYFGAKKRMENIYSSLLKKVFV